MANQQQAYAPVYDYTPGQYGAGPIGKVSENCRLYKVDGQGGKIALDHQPKMGEYGVHCGVKVKYNGQKKTIYH